MSHWVERLAAESPYGLSELDTYRLRVKGVMKGYGLTDEDLCEKFTRLGVDLARTFNRELTVNHVHAALRDAGDTEGGES